MKEYNKQEYLKTQRQTVQLFRKNQEGTSKKTKIKTLIRPAAKINKKKERKLEERKIMRVHTSLKFKRKWS